MSTRHLRKAYGFNDGIITLKSNDNNDEDSDELITIDKKSKTFNVFNLLNENSEVEDIENEDYDDDVVDDDDDNNDDDDDNNNELAAVKNNFNVNKHKKKRKKKKKNDKPKVGNGNEDDGDNNDSVDEIEKTVREVNKILGEPVASCSKIQDIIPTEKTKESILNVQNKYLNAANELKRICGSKIISELNKNRNRGSTRVGHLRKTWLTSLNDWFPPRKTGLSMIIDNKEKSKQFFVYDHSPNYRQIQMKFLTAVESQNPENIVNLLNAHPFHIDALLQFADLCKLNEDLQMSAEFVERAVHCLECAFHPLFNIATGNCRMNYRQQTNRPFFIALFKHLMFIGGRACYRTSLELCKVLLSLDPEGDPLAIVLAIDLYALRSKEYQWFIDFCQLWENSRNLTQLPNIAYSLALANYHLGNQEEANQLLEKALFMFPGILLNLLDKCGVETDSRVLSHNYFNSKEATSPSPALEKLQDLYVIRTFHLWKEADILPWIEACVHSVMDRVDVADEFAAFCIEKRKIRYQGMLPKNILRHIVLTDIKEVTINHPGMQNEGPIFSYDPLPPTDSINIYEKPGTVQRPTPSNSNLFSLFVSSLFMDLEGNVANAGLNHNINLYDQNELPDEFD